MRAVGAYGVTMGVAAVLGQLAGGLLISLDLFGLGWRTCFLVSVPVGLLALALIPRMVSESRATGRPRRGIPEQAEAEHDATDGGLQEESIGNPQNRLLDARVIGAISPL